jgi:Flp pilus assembly protein TadG
MYLKAFLLNKQGNVAIMFSLAVVPMLLAIGAATDILRVNNAQTILQGATDAAAIAGANISKITPSLTNSTVNEYLAKDNAIATVNPGYTVTAAADPQTGLFSVRLQGQINTTFMSLVGINTLDVGAYAEVDMGSQAMEVALVLDNTASMSANGKLDALKVASKSLLDSLFNNKPSGSYMKVGIVPFADYVNVGMANRNAPWMDVPADWTETIPNYPNVSYPNATGCHSAQGVWNNDGIPTPYTYQVCDNPGTPLTTYSTLTYQHRWYGCVGSRNDPRDRSIGQLATRYPGVLDTGCPSEITDLTDQKATLTSQIDAMTAVGETYIPQGLLWGWNILDSNAPYSTAKTTAAMNALKGTKAVILMTDGENTIYPDYASIHHYSTTDSSLLADTNDRMIAICNNIKSEGISIYTVAFQVNTAASKDLLVNCASAPNQAYDATDSVSLLDAFNQIGNQLAATRLTR